jgi:hypothetical protein
MQTRGELYELLDYDPARPQDWIDRFSPPAPGAP